VDLDRFFAPYNPPRTSLIDCLAYWTEIQPADVAYRSTDGEEEETALSYAEFSAKVAAVAARLTGLKMRGERALLLYPQGLDFLIGYYGCLAAGVVAVPAYPPRRNRNMARIQAISDDAQAKIALTLYEVSERSADLLDEAPHLKALTWLATDQVQDEEGKSWKPRKIQPSDLAMLQYTSGSTGTPKGVMLTHANIMHNCQIICWGFEPTRDSSGLSWLPTYHDMGLVGGCLKAMFYGAPATIMSPMSFLQKPVRWLRGISRHRITISGGPNFAYDLCTQKITDDQLEGIDLSCWKVAFNGAEPVRAETLEKFTERFAPYGFSNNSHYACYGMAETTLIVTGSYSGRGPIIRSFDSKGLDERRVIPVADDAPGSRALVGCGRVLPDEQVAIVNPENHERLPADRIGEIWVNSPSVTQGYWNKPEETAAACNFRLASGEGPFLRTGDFGFFYQDQLYVTGRLKDLIIVRGVNRYPQDIEMTVEKASPKIQPSAVGAFAVDLHGRERLIIVAEVERTRRDDWSDVIASVRQAVTGEHELPPDAVILVRFGSIPKTSSGKIQRHACRDEFLENTLQVIAQWRGWEESAAEPGPLADARVPFDSGAAAISKQAAAEALGVNQAVAHEVMTHVRQVAKERAKNLTLDSNIVTELGLDSLERLQIANTLEETFGGRFPEDVLAEMSTVREVAQAIEKYIGTEPRVQRTFDTAGTPLIEGGEIPPECYDFAQMPEYRKLKQTMRLLQATGIPNPYFSVHESVARDTTRIAGRELISFATYNYIAMSGDPVVSAAAKEAVDKYGTSVSASRLVSGEKPVHRQLEQGIADFLGVDDSIVFVGGHATNETTIGHLVGAGDLIAHDALAHNSIIQGALLCSSPRRGTNTAASWLPSKGSTAWTGISPTCRSSSRSSRSTRRSC
jgi:acyl carrier protein